MSDERGMSESLSWAILTPLLLLLVLGVIQVAVWAHGRTVASNAAVAAAEEAALPASSDASGRATAVGVGETIAVNGGLADVTVRLLPAPDAVTAVVTGRTVTFFDLGQSRISAQSTRPLERVSVP